MSTLQLDSLLVLDSCLFSLFTVLVRIWQLLAEIFKGVLITKNYIGGDSRQFQFLFILC